MLDYNKMRSLLDVDEEQQTKLDYGKMRALLNVEEEPQAGSLNMGKLGADKPASSVISNDDAAKFGIIEDEEDTLTQRLSANAKERYNPEGWGKFGEYTHKNPNSTLKYAGAELLGGAADTIEGVGKGIKAVTAGEDNLTAEQKAELGILEDAEDLQIPENVRKQVDEAIANGDRRVAEWKQNLDNTRAELREATGAPQIVTDVLNMAGQVALMGLTGAAAGGGAVRGLVGASTFGSSYDDVINDEGMDRGRALTYAAINAIGQGMLEGLGGIGGRKGVETALQSILSEGFEEGAGYTMETVLQNLLTDRNVPWSAKQAVYNSFIGALGGGAFAAGRSIGGKLVTPQMQEQAQQLEQGIENAVAESGFKEQATTYIDTNPETHTPEENQRIKEYVNSTDNGLLGWVNKVRSIIQSGGSKDALKRERFELQPVNEKTAAAVMLASGVNVAGYRNAIMGNEMLHIEKRHGKSGEADNSMQFAEDVARIPYVLNNFDNCELLLDKSGKPIVSPAYRDANNNPAPMVQFSKKINGTYYVVEAVPDSKAKELKVISAYISKDNKNKGVNQVSAMTAGAAPKPTPEALLDTVPLASNASVAGGNSVVNPKFAPSQYATNTMQQAAEADTLGQETADALADKQHRVIGWDETTTDAQSEIDKRGLVGSTNDLIAKAGKGEAFTSRDVQKAQILLQQLSKSQVQTERDLAIELGDALITASSDIGRALNIMRSMLRDLPGGLLRVTQRQVEKAGGTLTEQDIADINAIEQIINAVPEIQQAEGAARVAKLAVLVEDMSADYRKAVNRIFNEDADNADKWLMLLSQQKVADHTGSTAFDKFTAMQRINLLLNPKTQARNLLGNALSISMEAASDPFAAFVDKQLAKKTGQRTVGKGKISEMVRGAKEGAKEVQFARELGVLGQYGNRYTEGGKARPAKVFDDSDPVGAMGNWFNDMTTYLLTLGDAIYSGGRAAQVNAQLEDLGVDAETAASLATEAGRETTFQNDSEVSKKVLAMRNWLGDGMLSRIIMPFAKTPANILSRAASYSPLGLVEGAYGVYKVLNDANVSPEMQRKAATAIGRGIVGTLITTAGAGLAAAGKASGAAPEDKDEAAFLKDVGGILPNSLKIGNTWVDLSNIGPGMVSLNLGATVYNNLKDEGFDDNFALQLTETLLNGIVMDVTGDSLWDGLLDTAAYFEEGNLWGFVTNAAGDALSQLVPLQSMLRGITGSIDKYKRETSAKGNDLGWSVKYIASNLPGISNTMAVKRDVTGNPVERYEGGKASDIFNAWLNPAAGMSKDKTDSELYQQIMDVYEETGDKSVFPTVAPYSVTYKGEKYALRGKERSEYQQASGKEITQQLDELFASKAYKQATSEQQVDMIANLISYATAEAKTGFLEGKDVKYEKSGISATIDKLAADGVPASAVVMLAATDRDNDNGSNSGAIKAAKAINKLGLSSKAEKALLEQYANKTVAEAYQAAKANKVDVETYLDTYQTLHNAETPAAVLNAVRNSKVKGDALLTMLTDTAGARYGRFDSRWTVGGRSYKKLSAETYTALVLCLDGGKTKAENVKRLMAAGLSQKQAADFYTVYNSDSDKYD